MNSGAFPRGVIGVLLQAVGAVAVLADAVLPGDSRGSAKANVRQGESLVPRPASEPAGEM